MSDSINFPALSFKITWNFHMNFRISVSLSTKKSCWNFPGIIKDEFMGPFGEDRHFYNIGSSIP